ncbi:MAG: NAD(P)-dependent oxidoreductase [Gammaproteobacteria bacterium]|nr:NAD(P)-dependent oxidoreductase [Gammaproteobacteria bacterium]
MRITVLGMGLMGAAMARRLVDTGHGVTVYNRTPGRAQPLAAAGCRVAADAGEALQAGDFIILALADATAIEAVLWDGHDEGHLTGRVMIQMGTIGALESRALDERVRAAGGSYLEAPVLGSIPEATAGTLLVMAGGTAELFQRCLPLFEVLSRAPVHVGEVGQAATIKLALNQLIASLTTAFSLSLGLVQREGIEVETFMGLLRDSALYAPTFDKKLPRMLEHEYANPNFSARHLAKDIRLFSEQAAAAGLDAAMLDGVAAVVGHTIAAGFGDADYSALYEGVTGGVDAT